MMRKNHSEKTKATIQQGLIRILDAERSTIPRRGMESRLQRRIFQFLEMLKEQGLLPGRTKTGIHVELDDAGLQVLASIEEQVTMEHAWASTPSDVPHEGRYTCLECGHESVYLSTDIATNRVTTCPTCGYIMEATASTDFLPIREDMIAGKIKLIFEDDWLQTIAHDLENTDTARLLRTVTLADILSRDWYTESKTRNMLSEYYDPTLTQGQIWEEILGLLNAPPHTDAISQLRCWILALGRAQGRIEDFWFEVQSDGVRSQILSAFVPAEPDTPEAATHPSADSLHGIKVMSRIFSGTMRDLQKMGYMDTATHTTLISVLRSISNRHKNIAKLVTACLQVGQVPEKSLKDIIDATANEAARSVT